MWLGIYLGAAMAATLTLNAFLAYTLCFEDAAVGGYVPFMALSLVTPALMFLIGHVIAGHNREQG